MPTPLRYPRCLPLPGLAVMAVAGWWAVRYTPSWFDPDETCLRRSPCYGEAESVSALRSLSWLTWLGLLLVVAGVALCARALPSTPRQTPAGPSRWGHAVAAAAVAGSAAVLGGLVAVFAALGMSPSWAEPRRRRARGRQLAAGALNLTRAEASCSGWWTTGRGRGQVGWRRVRSHSRASRKSASSVPGRTATDVPSARG